MRIAIVSIVLASIVAVYGFLSYYEAIGDGLTLAVKHEQFSLMSLDEGQIVVQWMSDRRPNALEVHSLYRWAAGRASRDGPVR